VGDEITITLENGEKIIAKINNDDINKSLIAGESAKEKGLNLTASKAEQKNNKNDLTAVAKSSPSSTTENEQLTQILHAIQNLEQRIARLEETGDDPQQIQDLKQEIKVLETQKQTQLANNQQIQESNPSTKTNEQTSSQIADNPAKPNTGHALLIVGGLLVVGAALVIGYLLGKDKKTNK